MSREERRWQQDPSFLPIQLIMRPGRATLKYSLTRLLLRRSTNGNGQLVLLSHG